MAEEDIENLDEEDDSRELRFFLDKKVFVQSYSHGYQLKYIKVNERQEEIEVNAGYFANIKQALEKYVSHVLHNQPTENIVQVLDLLNKIESVILASVRHIGERLSAPEEPTSNPDLQVPKKKRKRHGPA